MNLLIVLILAPVIVVVTSHLFTAKSGVPDDSAVFFTDVGICAPVAYAIALGVAVNYGGLSTSAGVGLFLFSVLVSAGLYLCKGGFPRVSFTAVGVLICLGVVVSNSYAQSAQVGTVIQVSPTTISSQTGENNGSNLGTAIGAVIGGVLPKTSTGRAIGSIGGGFAGRAIGGIIGASSTQVSGQEVVYQIGGSLFAVTQPGSDLVQGDSVYVTTKEGKAFLIKMQTQSQPARKVEPTGAF